jgi:uncharacterized membrane protein YcaP (DUF421 family)
MKIGALSIAWGPLLNTAVSAAIGYFAVLALLRISRKRTLSRTTAFDMIVPFVLGPILASTILIPEVGLPRGIFAFALIIGLHGGVARLTSRSERIRRLVEREPTLLFHKGEFLETAMRREDVSRRLVSNAIRANGISDMSRVEAVVLEADGAYSVLTQPVEREMSSLSGVGLV